MAQRLYNPAPQFFYSGTPAAPLAGGKLYFYVPGTTTPKDTYSDNALTVANSNPVILSSSGLMPNVFLDGSYRVILTDKDGVQQPGWPRDSVNSIQDLAFSNWDSTITYGIGGANIVTASDGNYYRSIQAPNLAHEPSASPEYWELVRFMGEWNEYITYPQYANVSKLGQIYISVQADNINHDPSAGDAAWWASPASVPIANQAAMEAATNNADMVTPLATNWHPGVAKAWLHATGNGTTINASHNIASITDAGTGSLTVVIATDFSSANYAVACGGPDYSGAQCGGPRALTAGSFSLTCVGLDSPWSPQDPAFWSAECFGDQA